MSLEDFTHYIMSSKSWGVNATEPHTLLKKVLPIIWTSSGRLFQSLPLSSSFDSASLSGFTLYVQLAQNGVLAHSRELDKSFVNGSLHMLISGQWLIPSLHNIPHAVLSRFPGKSGLSVLSGDCLAISAKSDKAKAAQDFIKYLTSDSIASRFCTALPDAGIPALLSTDLFKKNLSSDYASFAEQCKHAILLPSTSVFIEAEKILEDEIMEAVYARKSPEEAFYQAKNLILQLEKLHGK
jgi:ABC-type glycerol-3-phosphate transport system substrate-binding protein